MTCPVERGRGKITTTYSSSKSSTLRETWCVRMTGAMIITSVMLAYTTLVSAFTSSIFSTATRTIAAQYHVSTEVGILGRLATN
ncbi:hypothetical protein NHQ30_011326 [Ciborinia camelliae]|nr:hypothetical protein NHQ30_011326 [Ciborinia camelliae]